MVVVKVLRTYRDLRLDRILRFGVVVEMDAKRAKELEDMGYVQLLKRPENKKQEKPKKTKKKAKKE